MTNAEKKNHLMEVVGNALAEHLEKNNPVTAAFDPFLVRFPVIDTGNIGTMKLTYDAPGKVRSQLGVYRRGTDRLYSNFMPAAAVEEMIRWLRDPATHQEWLEQIQHLSDSVDDYWD
jgi:hypothetical protein